MSSVTAAVGFKRGRYWKRVLGGLYGSCCTILPRCLSWCYGPSIWVSASLFVVVQCNGKECRWCAQRLGHLPRAGSTHSLVFESNIDGNGVCMAVDLPLKPHDEWEFIPVDIRIDDFVRFYNSERVKGYNALGVALQDLGLGSLSVTGVDASLRTDIVNAYSCTELVVTFLRLQGRDRGGPLRDLHLTPCRASAEELMTELDRIFHNRRVHYRYIPEPGVQVLALQKYWRPVIETV